MKKILKFLIIRVIFSISMKSFYDDYYLSADIDNIYHPNRSYGNQRDIVYGLA